MEKQKNRDANCIYLKDLLNRGIHFDEISKFKTSFFSEVYENAVSAVEEIVNDNRKKGKIAGERKKDQRIKSVANVISFIGRRGTGKSSVMMSFQDALRRYTNDNYQCEKYNNIIFGEEADMGNVRFFSLDYIDASALEESEDVFILVLANMLNYLYSLKSFSDEYNDNSKRELISSFERIYEEFLTLKNSKQDRDGVYSSFETLINVASSQRIRERFYNLVQQFIKYIRTSTDEVAKECYMVISIDDLDMAHYNTQNSNRTKSRINNKSYEIVNSIHKYFSIPGVIVLTAYNYENLMLQSEKFFIESDKTANDRGHEKESQQMTSSRLASQFVDKVFPASYRIYLPSWKKNDFGSSMTKIDVSTSLSNNNVLKKYVEEADPTLTIKRFILALYAEKAGIFYDPFGKKIHFLEPDSLRKTVDIVALVDGVEKIDYENEEENSEFNQKEKVLKRIKADVYFRFVQERLFLSEERVYFTELQELRIDRRSQAIVKEFCGKIPCLGRAVKRNIEKYKINVQETQIKKGHAYIDYSKVDSFIAKKEDNSKVRYSLAEFVHCIYHMTRNTEKYSKEMVACILNSYTVYLTELFSIYQNEKTKMNYDTYSNYMNKKKEDRISSNRKMCEIQEIFEELIGDSICGKWTEYFFPATYTIVTGATNKTEDLSKNVILGCANTNKSANKLNIANQKKLSEGIEDEIEACVMLCMFYPDILKLGNLKLVFDITNVADEQEDILQSIAIEFPGDEQRIELTAFFKYAFSYSEFFDKISELLITDIEFKINLTDEKQSQIKAMIQEKIRKMKEEYVKWDYEYSNMIVPVYSFDLFYNMIKRIFQKTSKKESGVYIKSGEDFLIEMENMNKLFTDYLNQVDAYYKLDKDKNGRFTQTFKECPFVKWLKKVQGNDQIVNSIGYIVSNIIADIVDTEKLEWGGDDPSNTDN